MADRLGSFVRSLFGPLNFAGLVVVAFWVEHVKDTHLREISEIRREVLERTNPDSGWRADTTRKLDRILSAVEGGD